MTYRYFKCQSPYKEAPYPLTHQSIILYALHCLNCCMAPKNGGSTKISLDRGAWTPDEDRKLAQCIEIHGPRGGKLSQSNQVINIYSSPAQCSSDIIERVKNHNLKPQASTAFSCLSGFLTCSNMLCQV